MNFFFGILGSIGGFVLFLGNLFYVLPALIGALLGGPMGIIIALAIVFFVLSSFLSGH